jgi:polysaccharide export outer membrane protein
MNRSRLTVTDHRATERAGLAISLPLNNGSRPDRKRGEHRFRTVLVLGIAVLLSACANGLSKETGPSDAFTPVDTAPTAQLPLEGYRIGPLDRISVNVYHLTLEDVQVDAGGQVLLPLIGNVTAAGKTAPELSAEIADRLLGRYLQSPQVTVRVSEILSQRVTVDGSVMQPGVYPLIGPTTLIQAVSLAKGPDPRFANPSRVVVFRTLAGERTVAVFDLKLIRRGEAPDPEIRGNDVIVVDGSQLKGVWREVVSSLPGLAIFRPF